MSVIGFTGEECRVTERRAQHAGEQQSTTCSQLESLQIAEVMVPRFVYHRDFATGMQGRLKLTEPGAVIRSA